MVFEIVHSHFKRKMNFSILLVLILSLVSLSCAICVQKSCPLGTFCPINTNCSSDTSLCVAQCNLKNSQGNWSSGNCELVPEQYDHWLDATFYEVLIPPRSNIRTAILNITFTLTRLFQSDDEDDMSSGSGSGSGLGSGSGSSLSSGNINKATFNLETDYSYFKFENGDTSHIALSDKDNAASLTLSCAIVIATSDPIPLGDYEMQISVTRNGNVLQSSGLVIHVVEPLPSSLPAAVTCVEFAFAEYTILESAGILNVTILLMGRTQPVSFNVTVIANDTAPSSAIAGVDFTPGRYNATFTTGATTATASIPIMIDKIVEETEQFTLRLYIDGTGYGLGLQNGNVRNATAFIIQSNITGVVVGFKETVYSVIEDDSVYNVTVIKQGNSLQDIVVNIFPTPESARLRSDYSQASVGNVIFAPGGPNEQTVQLSVVEDDLLELNETYLLRLDLPEASIAAGAQISRNNQARVTIINDDRIQVKFIRQVLDTKEFEEVIVPVGFSPQTTTIPFMVRVETFDLTPPDAQAGIDYQPFTQNFTLSPLVASVTIQVKIIENNITDGNRRFGLRIVIPKESQRLGIELGTPSELKVTIIDDDVGDLEIACFTNSTGDVINGHNIILNCVANQIVAYSCSINNQSFQPCLTPYAIRGVDTSDPVKVTVNAIAPEMLPVSLNLTALTATAELQIIDIGAVAVHLQASKNATFRCKLNDEQFITCDNGQIFDNLDTGNYSVTIQARGIENMQDIALYTIGPVFIAGVNATTNEVIAACFGSWKENCSHDNENCEYTANWRTKADQVEFTVMAKTQGWLGIGFSIDNKMPRSDVIVGATNGTNSFVEDRYAAQRSLPETDAMQNIHNVSATIINGVTTINFVRDKMTNDSDGDLNLNACHFVLFAWGDNVDFNTGVIQYHGLNQRSASNELICFPSAKICPNKFDCGDPGMPVNGARNFSSTLEDSVVTYSCDPGYNLIGNRTRVCKVTAEEGALWKYDIPKCEFLTVAFASSEFNGTEASGSIDVELILSQQIPSNTSIVIEIAATEQIPKSATGSGVDFVSDPFNAILRPGENNKSMSISIICDNVIEEIEFFKISFSVLYQSVPVQIGLDNATAIIIDSTAEVMFNQSTYVMNEETQLLVIAIKISRASQMPIGISINVTNTTTTGESFVQKVISGTINSGITEQSFPLELALNNNIIECTKSLSVSLSTQGECITTTKNNSIAEINIINDDVGMVSLQIPDTVTESANSISINISLNATATEDIVFNVITSDISTTAGSDYNQTTVTTPSMSSLTISSGELFGSLDIEIIDDTIKEQNETFLITVRIQDSCLPLVINGNDTFSVTIIDNEELMVEFSQALFSGLESSGGITVMLSLLGGTASYMFNATITISSSSATGGIDYDNTPLIATFNAGDTTATVVLPIVNDNIKEEEEELNLTIAISPLTGVKLGTLINANVVIIDTTLPKIITHPMNLTVEVNNVTTNIQLHCMANGAVSYRWEKQNDVIPADAEGVNNGTLTLIGVTPRNGGQYRCVAINEHGRNYSNYATVIVTAHPPVVTVTPSSIAAAEGDSIALTCLATAVGASNFTYEWLLNNSLINGATERNYNIIISEMTIGNYTCIVKNQFGGSSQSNTAILTLKPPFCNPVTVMYTGFNITWNETQVGDTVEASCTGDDLAGIVKRKCIGKDTWDEVIECIREEYFILMEETNDLVSSLSNFTDMEIIAEVEDIVTDLANLTLPDQMQTQFTSEFVAVVDILSLLNNVTDTVTNMLQPNDTFFERTVQVIDNLLNNANEGSWKQLEQMSPSTSQTFISNIEQFGRLLGETLDSETMKSTEARENIVIKAEIVTQESISLAQPYVFPDNSDNVSSFTGRNGQILLPSMLLQDVLEKLPQGSTEFVITNFVLRDGSLPLTNPSNGSATREPVSSIISSQLPIPVDTTEHPITLIFDVPSTTPDKISDDIISRQQHTCEFYNHTLSLNIQTGAWSRVGIELDQSQSNKTTVTCLSSHLTSFAVLVGIQNETQLPSPEDDRTLSAVIYIGSALSLVCLILSIIILGFILCKNKGKEKLVFIHLNLCIALALGLVVLIAGIENATDDRISCVVVAVLLQYFFTSAFCWMLSEGVMLYMMLVTVFGNKLNHQWFFFVLGWGPAIPIVAISLGITHEQYGTDDHCWVESGKGALAAFILPIVIVIVITCAFLLISIRILYANQRKSISKKKSTRNVVKALFKVTVIFLPLLGVTWIFGILAVNEEPAAFAWIFAILNVILGILIFVFHVASNDQVGLNKKMKEFYKSETFYTFYSGIRYYTVSRNNGKNRSSNGDTNNHNVKMSTTVDSIEEQPTTTTTFKPPDIPLEERGVGKDPTMLMATNPLEETVLSEDVNTTDIKQEVVKEETTSIPTSEH